jgi:hypothetical protein
MNIQKKFNKFHSENPIVYRELVRLARVAKVQGLQHYGAKAMLEALRFNLILKCQGYAFKINNNFTSRYARMISKKESDLRGFFETRKLKA